MIDQESKNRLLSWWNYEPMDRPCILAYTDDAHVMIPDSDDYWQNPLLLVDYVYRKQKQMCFWGEAVPYLYIDYGASALALQLGAKGSWADNNTIWADPFLDSTNEVVALTLGGKWKTIQDTAIAEGIKKCAGQAMLSSYCLGASADTTAALIGTETLLFELIENPAGVKLAFDKIKCLIIEKFLELSRQCNIGGTILNGWHGIWAPEASTPIQEDFSYMISTDMFREFCYPHICDLVDAVPYSFYHLDGISALRHLSLLCTIPNLRVIQWQPGDGHSAIMQWTSVIKTILDSGKSCHVYVQAKEVFPLIKEVGSRGMLLTVSGTKDEIMNLAEPFDLTSYRYGSSGLVTS